MAGYGCRRFFTDTKSGKNAQRPELPAVAARPQAGQTPRSCIGLGRMLSWWGRAAGICTSQARSRSASGSAPASLGRSTAGRGAGSSAAMARALRARAGQRR
ncbi:hypothetical protein [Nonomuraea sp. NPDC003754]